MPQYLLLIYDNEAAWTDIPAPEQERLFGAYMALAHDLRDKGQLRGGEALERASTATCLRKQGGKIVHTDGPYAETKEQLGGFFLVEAKDLDEALAIAARIPSVDVKGTIEVRPIMPTPKSM